MYENKYLSKSDPISIPPFELFRHLFLLCFNRCIAVVIQFSIAASCRYHGALIGGQLINPITKEVTLMVAALCE
jgi:hypothetical protein